MRTGLSPAALLRVRDAIAPHGQVSRVRPLRGGVSSSVHLVHLVSREGKRSAVVVRRYGEYWQRVDPAACAREFKLLQVLANTSLPTPTPLLLDEEGGPFGAPTVIMSRLPGRPLLAPRDLGDYLRQMAHTLAALHRLPTNGLDFLPDQRAMVTRSFASAPENRDPLTQAVWNAARAEWERVSRQEHARVLVHGDYWPGNLLWARHKLVGVVDWEQPRLGDPVKDVATCRGDLAVLFGPQAADTFVSQYEAASGSRVANLKFWDLFISTWAVPEMDDWMVAYRALGRTDITPQIGRDRIRAFAHAALGRA